MMISIVMLTLIAFGALSWIAESYRHKLGKLVALLGIVLASVIFVLFVSASVNDYHQLTLLTRISWIESLNIEYALALDHLSILLISLTLLLGIICVLVSWYEIKQHSGFYYFNLMATLAGIIGVFTAVDMFLFFVFWEVMLLPMTALIAIWGHENRHFAAIKFFIFTQVSSLLMLIAIIAMAYFHQQATGSLSFYYLEWRAMDLPLDTAYWLMLGFFIAFAVKLPSVPVHSWLPDAHTQAPTAGSVLLAGVLLKTGAYGLIRFVVALFPEASIEFAPIAATLAVISILYGAKMAFSQFDMKRLIAYSSISHMGFVMLAVFASSEIAMLGAVMTMVAHGLSSAALFAMAGMVYHRTHTRDLRRMGGIWTSAPRMGGFALAFAGAAFGLPGLANFVGEFYSLVGAFALYPTYTVIAAFGLIFSAVYGMALFQRAFQGPTQVPVMDLSIREWLVTASLLILLILFGVYPNLILQYSYWGGY